MPKPTKPDIAKFKVMKDMGFTPNTIGKRTGYDPKTVRAYLSSEVYDDPEIQKMIENIKARELNDLHLLGGKARTLLQNYLDSVLQGKKEANPISITAILDRTFQQRRLLEDRSTENIAVNILSPDQLKRMAEEYLKSKQSSKGD